jgi:hypothetical protein
MAGGVGGVLGASLRSRCVIVPALLYRRATSTPIWTAHCSLQSKDCRSGSGGAMEDQAKMIIAREVT